MNPVFLKSAARRADFPADTGREVALVGRSNSGKSSAMNAILGARALARVSKTPGRTQLVNFFQVAQDRRVVDLPGYGFARVAPQVRERWRGLLAAYMEERRSLAGLMMTVDIRRDLSAMDESMLEWAASLEIPAVLLLTKSDKLSRSAALGRERKIVARAPAGIRLTRFSARTADGVADARDWLRAWLGLDPASGK